MPRIESPPSTTLRRGFAAWERLAEAGRWDELRDYALERYVHWDDLRRRRAVFGDDVRLEDVWAAIHGLRFVEWAVLPLPSGDGGYMKIANRLERVLATCHEIEGFGLGLHGDDLGPEDEDPADALGCTLEELRATVGIEGARTSRAEAEDLWWELVHTRNAPAPTERRLRMLSNAMRAWRQLPAWAEGPLTPDLLCRMQGTLTRGTLDDPNDVGRFRTDDDVRVFDSLDGLTAHVPPPAATLETAISALCAFANAREASRPYLHPLVRAVLLHFALAYYHPFGDGNGRTARLLFQWSVYRQRDLRWLHSVPVSRAILRCRGRYDRSFHLTETDGLDTTHFVLDQLDFVHQAAKEYREHLVERQEQHQELRRRLRAEGLNSRQLDTILSLAVHPAEELTQAGYARRHGVTQSTASLDLNDLVKRGLLDKVGGRPILYRAARRTLQRLQVGHRKRK